MSVFQFTTASNFDVEGEPFLIDDVSASKCLLPEYYTNVLLLLAKQIHLVYLKLMLVTR